MKPEACDVLVVGGGSAGVAAALAAARRGAWTILLERNGGLGGMGNQAGVHTFCGLYHPEVGQGARWLNEGIPAEIGQQMLDRTGQTGPDLMGRVFVLRSHPAVWANLALDLTQAEADLHCLTRTMLLHVKREAAGWSVAAERDGSVMDLQCGAIIDCSGDATVAQHVSPEHSDMAAGKQLYRPAMVAVFPGITEVLTDDRRLELAVQVAQAVRAGRVPKAALAATFRSSPCSDEVFVSLDLEAGGAAWNPGDSDKKQAAWDEAEATVLALATELRATHPLFQTMGECRWPEQLGIRESARWRGDYVLTGEDLIRNRRFADDVALAGWPLEMRETARGPKFRYFDRPEPAGIPLRCLRLGSLPGIFFAGRCLSADHEALASVRVMGTCLATGQAAGVAAVESLSRPASTTVPEARV